MLSALTLETPAGRKLKVGFYGITGCAGCQLSVIFNEDELLDLLARVDLRAFPLVRGREAEGQFDVVFMEGLVACEEDLRTLQDIRARTTHLIALGACAHTGCVPAYRDYTLKEDYQHLLFTKRDFIKDLDPSPLHEHIAVDYTIPGCPPDRQEILRAIVALVHGTVPLPYRDPVCVECRRNGTVCLLEQGKLCLGPVTRGGCHAVCTTGNFECWGCRGFTDDANFVALASLLRANGFTDDDVTRRMHAFSPQNGARP